MRSAVVADCLVESVAVGSPRLTEGGGLETSSLSGESVRDPNSLR
jgi:hypothetical protein